MRDMQKVREARKGGYVELNPIIQSKNASGSYVKAIKAKCAECVGCSAESVVSGWRTDVKDCTSPNCPLFTFRPYK